jgi:hypothetical protein
MAGLAWDGTRHQTDGDEADPPTERKRFGFLKGTRYRESPVKSARFPADPNETRALTGRFPLVGDSFEERNRVVGGPSIASRGPGATMNFWRKLFGGKRGGNPTSDGAEAAPKKCQRCGKPGQPPVPPAVYGEPLPFRVTAIDTRRQECYWLCRDCYTWASLQLSEKGSVTIIAK